MPGKVLSVLMTVFLDNSHLINHLWHSCPFLCNIQAKRMRFPIDVILVCIRWYAAYPLSYRHLEEMMQERGVVVDHSSINC